MHVCKSQARTNVEVLVRVALLDVAEEDQASLEGVLRGDVVRRPGDGLDGADRPRVPSDGRGDGRAEDDVDLAAVGVEDRGRGAHRGGGGGEDGEGSDELGGGEHGDWYRYDIKE